MAATQQRCFLAPFPHVPLKQLAATRASNCVASPKAMLWAEFVLHGLSEHSRLGRRQLFDSTRFSDMVGSVFSGGDKEEESN